MSRQPLRSHRHWLLRSLLIAAVVAGCADREPPTAAVAGAPKAALFDEWGNARLVVDLEIDPGSPIVKGVVLVSAPKGKEVAEFALERRGDELYGTIALPVGEERRIDVRALDGDGRETHSGGTLLTAGKEPTSQLDLVLEPRSADAGEPVPVFVGSYRLAMTPRRILAEEMGNEIRIEGRLLDPDGELVPMEGDVAWRPPADFQGDIKWTLEGGVANLFGWPVEPPKKLSPFELCYLALRYCRTTKLIPEGLIPTPDWYALADGGGAQTCVMKRSGRTRCWGDGAHITVPIIDPFRFATVSAGGLAFNATHACAIDRSSVTWCWGDNSRGQLGNGSLGAPAASAQPVQVGVPQPLVSVSAGGRHSCGLTAAGTAFCWGDNDWGQLGAGQGPGGLSVVASATPLPVAGKLTFSQISAGYEHTCGLTTGGDLYCWGYGLDDRLGSFDKTEYCGSNATRYCAHAPRLVTPVGVKFSSVSVGVVVSCALSTAGAAYCWGASAIGSYGVWKSLTPLAVMGGHTFTSIAAGGWSVCGVKDDQQVLCWGSNASGELGTGDQLEREIPDTVSSTARYESLGAGPNHFCAVTVGGGRVDCWGLNTSREIGYPSPSEVLTPTRAPSW